MPNEPIPSATIETMLDAQWNASNVLEPTYYDVNDGETPARVDFRDNDVLLIAGDSPTFQEEPIGTWVYANQTSRVLVEVYTRQGRQRLYNIMREVRRVCHSRMHALTDYQRIQFQSFVELVETGQQIWIGRIIIELLNSSKFMNTAD